MSNHRTHSALLYENSPVLNSAAEPDGILRRVSYPHGLRFSADGRHLFVADAGAPYLHIYSQDPDQWRGVRHPVATVRIMDDAVSGDGHIDRPNFTKNVRWRHGTGLIRHGLRWDSWSSLTR